MEQRVSKFHFNKSARTRPVRRNLSISMSGIKYGKGTKHNRSRIEWMNLRSIRLGKSTRVLRENSFTRLEDRYYLSFITDRRSLDIEVAEHRDPSVDLRVPIIQACLAHITYSDFFRPGSDSVRVARPIDWLDYITESEQGLEIQLTPMDRGKFMRKCQKYMSDDSL